MPDEPGERLASILLDDPFRVRHGMAPVMNIGCREPDALIFQEPRKRSVSGTDFQAASGSDHPSQGFDQRA